MSYKNITDGRETSGLFLDPTFVYVQALGVFSLEITKWALCCWKHLNYTLGRDTKITHSKALENRKQNAISDHFSFF